MKKKIHLFILFIVLFSKLNAQKAYTDRAAYERALEQYSHALESYDNYIRKLHFFSRVKVPAGRASADPGGFVYTMVVPLMYEHGVKLDNFTTRLYPDVTPEGLVNFYYFLQPDRRYLKIVISDRDTFGYIHLSEAYSFRHPGKPPVYKPGQIKNKSGKMKVTEPAGTLVVSSETTGSTKEVLKKRSFYLMPNGDRYWSRETLNKAYPMFRDERVFSLYFERE